MADTQVQYDLSVVRAYEHPQLGKIRAVLKTMSDLPEGFAFPSLAEMVTGGSGVCSYSHDMEHEQEVDGMRLLTSVVWVADHGMWEFPDGVRGLGCQWVARVTEWPWWPGSWDSDLDSDLAKVVLDCGWDADRQLARTEALRLLCDAVEGRF